MNQELLTVLARERRRAVREDFARGDELGAALRSTAARMLRATGDRMFRYGASLDKRVTAPRAVKVRL